VTEVNPFDITTKRGKKVCTWHLKSWTKTDTLQFTYINTHVNIN